MNSLENTDSGSVGELEVEVPYRDFWNTIGLWEYYTGSRTTTWPLLHAEDPQTAALRSFIHNAVQHYNDGQMLIQAARRRLKVYLSVPPGVSRARRWARIMWWAGLRDFEWEAERAIRCAQTEIKYARKTLHWSVAFFARMKRSERRRLGQHGGAPGVQKASAPAFPELQNDIRRSISETDQLIVSACRSADYPYSHLYPPREDGSETAGVGLASVPPDTVAGAYMLEVVSL
jgi:hypothetical protein